MVYKNNKIMMIGLLLLLLAFLYYTYQFKAIEYRTFGTIGVIWSSILYIFTLFEYFKIDDTKIIHVYRLGLKKEEIYIKDIKRMFIISDKYFKAIRIDYGNFSEKNIVINSGVKNYKELIRMILNRIKDNPNISIDKRLDDYIK